MLQREEVENGFCFPISLHSQHEEEKKEKQEVEGIFKILKASYACPLEYLDPQSREFNCILDCKSPLSPFPFSSSFLSLRLSNCNLILIC